MSQEQIQQSALMAQQQFQVLFLEVPLLSLSNTWLFKLKLLKHK
jgi:hypothetical protein